MFHKIQRGCLLVFNNRLIIVFSTYRNVSNNALLTLPISFSQLSRTTVVGNATAHTSNNEPKSASFPTCIWNLTLSNFKVVTTTTLGYFAIIGIGC